jgi:exonuclease V gamma subunit
MEPSSEHIADIAQRCGLSEHEARILYHLDEAADLYWQLWEENSDDPALDVSEWNIHQQALVRMLMMRVVKRDYPDGWLTEGEKEARMEQQQGEPGEDE